MCTLPLIAGYVGFQGQNRMRQQRTPKYLKPIKRTALAIRFRFDLVSFRWRTGTKPAQSNDGNRSRIGSIYENAVTRPMNRTLSFIWQWWKSVAAGRWSWLTGRRRKKA